jgi:hypothetical protein
MRGNGVESIHRPKNAASPNKRKHTKEIMDNAKAKSVYDTPLGLDKPITLADIQRAKAVLAQAEAALGVAQPKAKVLPVPTHPRHLKNPAFGDKTPAVVEWYRDNDPEEYKRRYAGRKTHLEDRPGVADSRHEAQGYRASQDADSWQFE